MGRLVIPLQTAFYTKHHHTDFSQDNAELGAILNGFSLSETGVLASAIETTGRAVDSTYMSTAKLVSAIDLDE